MVATRAYLMHYIDKMELLGSALLLCHVLILLSLLPLSVRPDRLTAVYRTHFGCCRYLDT
jgi:hypothetical protein